MTATLNLIHDLIDYCDIGHRVKVAGRPESTAVFPGGMDTMLKAHGRGMLGQALPAGYRPGALQQCYANTTRLCMEDDSLTYFEGVAARASLVFPVTHAWAVDTDGGVIDVTWQDAGECAYYGVAFTTDFVVAHGLRTGVHGIFDSHFEVKDQPMFQRGVTFDDQDRVTGYCE